MNAVTVADADADATVLCAGVVRKEGVGSASLCGIIGQPSTLPCTGQERGGWTRQPGKRRRLFRRRDALSDVGSCATVPFPRTEFVFIVHRTTAPPA